MIRPVKTSEKQLTEMINGIPIRLKLRIFRKLEKDTRRQRWEALFKKISERRKKHKMTSKEISREIERARNEFYARRS